MYLLGVNTTTNESLSPVGNYAIWSARLRFPDYKGQNLAERVEIKSDYVTTRETLAHKSIHDHLTRMATNVNASKAPQKTKNEH